MKKISEKVLFDGEWISVHGLVYQNKHGEEIVWETVRRKRSKAGVVVIAKLIPSQRFILVKQFRSAVNGYVIGFPAGLADGQASHALVELKEETGYTGTIKDVSPVLKTGSSLIDDNGHTVYIEVDENDPYNQNPKQNLEPSEDIDVILIRSREAKDFLLNEHKKGTHISSNLWYLFVLSSQLGISGVPGSAYRTGKVRRRTKK